jgi:signal transduction histidine kinase
VDDPVRVEALAGWLVPLRWLALAAVGAVVATAGPLLGELPPGALAGLLVTAGALGLYNLTLALTKPGAESAATRPATQIVADCVALAALLHFSGGMENPFFPLFVLHVVSANIALSPGTATGILVLACALAVAVVVGEGTGLLPHYCLRPSGCAAVGFGVYHLAFLGGLILTLGASSVFARILTGRLRGSESKLAHAVDELSLEKEELLKARSEAAIERSRLSAIVDCMADAVTFSDRDGHVLLSNPRAQRLMRTAMPGAVQGPTSERWLTELFRARERDSDVSAGEPFESGSETYEPTSALVRAPGGTPIGLVVVMREVGDRVELEQRLMHEERMSVVGKLAASVAHEINNPIGVVSLYTQHAMTKVSPDDPVYGHLETIKRNADACRKITEQLLGFSRANKPQRERIDLRLLCDEIVESLRPLAQKSQVTLQQTGHVRDVPLWTVCDAGQLRQAVLNLMLNAIEAMPGGGSVAVRAYEAQSGPSVVRVVEVTDDGPGIAEEDLARIFQPFFTTKDQGTGLGLAVAENIAKSHGGHMVAESSPDRGTTFRLLLPIKAPPADIDAEQAAGSSGEVAE